MTDRHHAESIDRLLDTVSPVETPEGVELGLRPAGPLPRMLAWLIDTFVRLAGILLLGFALSGLGRFGWGLILIAAFVVEWFYPTLFEIYNQGQTPGKRALQLRVLRDTGAPVDWPSSLIRNLLRVVDFLPLGYGFAIVSMLATRDFKRLGDIGAGTVVVYADHPATLAEGVIHHPLPPPVALTVEEQQALIAFAERYPGLSQARASELAGLATPLLDGGEAAEQPERLLRMASWLVGSR
jgi:uncharacterized RDD family membrane protein YckC